MITKRETVNIVDIVIEKVFCEDCDCEMEQYPVVLTTYPAQYQYQCPKCKKINTSYDPFYPKTIITLSNGDKKII